MNEVESHPHVEDIEPDETAAAGVVGGWTNKQREAEIRRLEREGFVGVSCEARGDVFVNKKTHQRKIVPFVTG